MRNSTILPRFNHYPSVVKIVISLGFIFRLAAWLVYSPSWKTHAHLYPMYIDNLKYIGDFVSYVPGRLPFFNLFSFWFFRLTEPFFGTRALSLFALIVSVVSLPYLYEAAKGLFNQRTAVFSLVLYAFYPKLLVLGAWGMAEVGTVGFIVFTLFAIERAINTEQIEWYLSAGLFAALANITYLSTVMFIVCLSVGLYLRSLRRPPSFSIHQLVPDRKWWAYSFLPGIFGLLYLRYGPLLSDLPDNYSEPLFIGDYTLLGNAVHYIGYTFFDFWWHTRGFDNESGIIRIINNIEILLGPLFSVYFIGWSLITVTITVIIVFGLIRLSRQRGFIPHFFVGWAVLYVLVKLIENAGWSGTFQTRHLIAVFPAFVVAFGFGISRLLEELESQRQHDDSRLAAVIETAVPNGYQIRTVLASCMIIGLVCLCVNATANGVLRPDNKVESATAAALESQVDEEDVVATLDYTGYAETMVYTHGRVVPRVIRAPGGSLGAYDRPGPLRGLVLTTPAGIANTSIDYITAHTTCHEFHQRDQSYLAGAEQVGKVTYNKTFKSLGPCTSHAKIVRIEGAKERLTHL